MSTERTPIVTDERVEKTIKALYLINGLTKGPDTRMQLIRRVAAERMACELRDIYEAALASKDAEIEALRNPWISVKDYDQAISEEIKNVSHVQYDSHEICKHFASKVRSRLTAAATNNTNDNEAR